MGRTNNFVKRAKMTLKSIEEGKISREFLDFYLPLSKSRCVACHERLHVTNVITTGSGTEYQFRCGHTFVAIGLHEIKSAMSGGSYSRVGMNRDGVHDVHIELSGLQMNQDNEEIALTKLFCHYHFPDLSNFQKDNQYSSVDVIAMSKDKTVAELFQITKINDEKYWTEINSKDQIDQLMPNIAETVQKAVTKKKEKYADSDRNKMILLIDARPGVVKGVASAIAKSTSKTLNESGFKQIWIVGKARMLTHRLA